MDIAQTVTPIISLVCYVVAFYHYMKLDKNKDASTNVCNGAFAIIFLLLGSIGFDAVDKVALHKDNAEIIQLLKADAPSTVEASNGR